MSSNSSVAGMPRRTVSETHQSWWPGWIWGIPIAAIAIVVWLVLRAVAFRGVQVTITFEEAGGLKAGDSKVLYRGMNVGEVRSLALEADGVHVTAQVDMDRNVERFLCAGTRFYLQEPSLSDVSSLKAVIAGSSIVLVPGPGLPVRHFVGYLGKPPESLRVRLAYLVMLDGDVGDLKRGAPVKMRGFTVGEVTDVRLYVDAAGALVTPVVLTLDPTRFHIQGAQPTHGDWRSTLNTTLAELIQHGLRARLTQAPPLLGAREVTLEIEPHADAANLRTRGGPYPEIPASGERGVGSLLVQAGEVPLGEIGRNVRELTAHLAALASSRELNDSVVRLDRTLSELDRTVHAVGPRLPPTIDSVQSAVDSLRAAAKQIDATAAVARRTIGSRGAEQGANVQDALRELTEAARAARSLANELDERPESIIRGR